MPSGKGFSPFPYTGNLLPSFSGLIEQLKTISDNLKIRHQFDLFLPIFF